MDWLKSQLRGDQGTLFIVVVWWCWRWRNEMVLGSTKWTFNEVLHRIDMSYRDAVSCWGNNAFHGTIVAKEVTWKPPKAG